MLIRKLSQKLIGAKTNSKYLIGYLDEVIRLLVLIIPKMSGYVTTIKVKDGDKDKNNKLLSFGIDDVKLLEEYEAIRSYFKIEDSKNIELNALPVCDDRYIKTKIRTYDDKVYSNFRGLIVPKDYIECESFRVISIDSLLLYQHKCYLQVYLDTCTYIIANKQITGYLDDNLFKT